MSSAAPVAELAALSVGEPVEWPANRVRDTFVSFFTDKCAHVNYKSSPVVPHDDPTLLFANAGMNQFKPIFLGQADPTGPLAGMKRAANSQKCIRAGGKHNDLDDVGKDTYHHTYFEMLGNWSFGDYFKEEAITWAWQLLTEVYGMPKVRAGGGGARGGRGSRARGGARRAPRARGGGDGAAGEGRIGTARRARFARNPTSRTPPPSPPPPPSLQDRIYASYFAGGEGLPEDVEAKAIWGRFLPPERILPFDKKANFWEMGETGPCGPCSEIHFDRIGGRDAASLVNGDDPTVIEIWNIVFMQFNREPNGSLRELPAKHIDTGMGFERLTSILQKKMSNYDTDVFMPIFAAIHASCGGAPYAGLMHAADTDGRDMAYRVVADHIRTLTFAITDGAVPSAEGRGYVLRRVLRRAVRYAQQFLKAKVGFFSSLVPVVVDNFAGAFPELRAKAAFVQDIIRDEEESFSRTLSKGIRAFSARADELKAAGVTVVPGDAAFFLYDSMGFPLDLTQIMAGEVGLTVDAPGFYAAMAAQKARSQAAQKFSRGGAVALVLEAEQTAWLAGAGVAPTDDAAKYVWNETPAATVRAIYLGRDKDAHAGFLAPGARAPAGDDALGVVLDATPFYAESGGQTFDVGELAVLPAGAADDAAPVGLVTITDTQVFGGFVLHVGAVTHGSLGAGDRVVARVDYARRADIGPNHTMTHVLNLALRRVLGDGVDQRGSVVLPEKLRFDYATNKAPTPAQLGEAEAIVAAVIERALPVHTAVVPLADAKGIAGLRAVFGETYPDPVRVVSVGATVEALLADPASPAWRDLSIEFCGGTHIANTSRAGAFALVSDEAVAKGVRRVTALTRDAATTAHGRARELEGEFAVARSLAGDALEAALLKLKADVDAAVVPAAVKAALRDAHAELTKALLAQQKAAAGALADAGKVPALAAAAAAAAAGARAVVVRLDALGADGKAALAVAEAVRKAHPELAFFGVSSDGKDKALAWAATPKGASAKEWVAAVLAAADGKGGGSDASAQGTTKAVGKADQMVADANAWAAANVKA